MGIVSSGDPPPNRRGVAFRVAVLPFVDAFKTLQPQHLNRRDARGVFYPRRSITRRGHAVFHAVPALQLDRRDLEDVSALR